ncbi:MAG: hypothetical protein ACSLEZ_09075 [Thiobacillus sp.]
MKSNLMKKTLGILALSTLGLMATGAQANWERGGQGYGHAQKLAYQQSQAFSQQINARQDRQKQRIQAGMHKGKLTRAEFRELMQEQHSIRVMEQRFRADGLIDAREFKRLDRALDIADHNIRAEKHDRQARQAYGHPRFN